MAQIKQSWAVDPVTGCWNWALDLTHNGYGKKGFRQDGKTKTVRAHRWVYEQLRGPIPEGMTLDHLCRNKKCVNPEHLEPVTLKVNILRGDAVSAKNARKTHCPQGHLYNRTAGGQRRCNVCDNANKRKRYKPTGVPRSSEKTHCKRGHVLAGDNARIGNLPGGRTVRICRECVRIRQGKRPA